MISENDVDKALQYLRASAQEAAQARANVRYLEQLLKSQKASLKLSYTGMSNVAAEDQAFASAEYREALEGYRVAVERDALHAFKREAADALIRAWQTMCSNARSEGKAYS